MRCEQELLSNMSFVPFGDLLLEPLRNGLTKPKAVRGDGVKMIGMGEIFANSRIGAISMSRAPVTEKELSNNCIKKGDILFARQSLALEGAGKCSIVIDVTEETVFESHLIRARIDSSKANPYFVYYYFNSYIGKEHIKTIVEQVAAAGIRGSDLVRLKVPCPDLETQDRIAAILSALDEKIAINREINDNLADLLQTVYQDRFGNTSLVANQGFLSDICSYSRDKVAVSELNVSTYFSTENMLPGKAGSTEATSLPTTPQTTACHKGDTLISNIRPYFKKIVYCADKCGCSTDVLCFTPSQPQYSAYLFSTLYADKFFAFMVAGSKGTKMPRGDKQQIMTYPVVLPSEAALGDFNAIALPLIDQIYSYRAENKQLSLLRDTLLTKLLSGEIDVSDIQL